MKTCPICNEEVSNISKIAEIWLKDLIKKENPSWVSEDGACLECLDYYHDLQGVVEVIDS